LGKTPDASLTKVAIAAGIGRATLHRYFPTRDHLLRALAAQAARELENAADRAAKGVWSHTTAMKRILEALVPLGERHMFLMNGVTENFPDVQHQLDRQKAEFRVVIEHAQKEGLCPLSCPVEWVEMSFDLMIYGAWQLVREGHATPKQAAKLAWTTFTSGLKKAKL